MERIDFRHQAILGAHAQLTRLVARKQLSVAEACDLSIKYGDALVEAMTVDVAQEIRASHAKAPDAPPDEL